MTSIHTDHLEVLLIIEEWMYKPKPFFLKCFTQPHTENCLKMFRALTDFVNSLNIYMTASFNGLKLIPFLKLILRSQVDLP